jgi:flagellar hook-basal body complex protein FliE
MPTINDVISAYRTTAQRATAAGGDSGNEAAGGPSFGSLVKDAVHNAVEAGKKSEAISGLAVMGKADMTEVAQAVNNADITLQSVVAVRDKVVAAYQQIMQMPI